MSLHRSRRSVRLEIPLNGDIFIGSREAWKLLKGGDATVVTKTPFVLRLRDRGRWSAVSDGVYLMSGAAMQRAGVSQ